MSRYFQLVVLLSSSVLPGTVQSAEICASNRSFRIDFEHDRFLKDGVPYQFISGALHYFRIPEEYWEDRIVKAKAAGLNAIETYIPWNFHEHRPEEYDFSGRANVTEFIRLAQKHGLDFILRMGPYACGELDNGGLPWWLMRIAPDMYMRTSDPRYLYYVSKWYFKLIPMIMPLLYKNGGPIIMLQVENEYGSFFNICDIAYKTFLRDLFRSYVGDDVVLFTVDGGTMRHLTCGFTPGLYPTVGSTSCLCSCMPSRKNVFCFRSTSARTIRLDKASLLSALSPRTDRWSIWSSIPVGSTLGVSITRP